MRRAPWPFRWSLMIVAILAGARPSAAAPAASDLGAILGKGVLTFEVVRSQGEAKPMHLKTVSDSQAELREGPARPASAGDGRDR